MTTQQHALISVTNLVRIHDQNISFDPIWGAPSSWELTSLVNISSMAFSFIHLYFTCISPVFIHLYSDYNSSTFTCIHCIHACVTAGRKRGCRNWKWSKWWTIAFWDDVQSNWKNIMSYWKPLCVLSNCVLVILNSLPQFGFTPRVTRRPGNIDTKKEHQ